MSVRRLSLEFSTDAFLEYELYIFIVSIFFSSVLFLFCFVFCFMPHDLLLALIFRQGMLSFSLQLSYLNNWFCHFLWMDKRQHVVRFSGKFIHSLNLIRRYMGSKGPEEKSSRSDVFFLKIWCKFPSLTHAK